MKIKPCPKHSKYYTFDGVDKAVNMNWLGTYYVECCFCFLRSRERVTHTRWGITQSHAIQRWNNQIDKINGEQND